MAYYKRVLEKTPVGDITIYAQDDYIIKIKFGKYEIDEYPITEGLCKVLLDVEVQLDQYFHGLLREFKLDLICEATEYEQLVWSNLCSVEYGEKITYKELAKICGNVKGSRAVAKALSKNNLPIIIPCHRVIKSDGSIGGYTPNTNIKKILLELEEKYSNLQNNK